MNNWTEEMAIQTATVRKKEILDILILVTIIGANILRDTMGNVKLADFGASKRLQVTVNEIFYN